MTAIRAVLTLACLTVFATTAAAECAWVLWEEQTRLDYAANTEEQRWRVSGAAVSQQACEALLAQEVETVTPAQRSRTTVVYKGADFLQFRTDRPDDKVSRVERFDYVCLPDTVDPRGPKPK